MKKTKIILPVLTIAVMFLMGTTSISAQGYVSSTEATELLMQEVKDETTIFESTSSTTELKERAAFRIKYYNSVLYNLGEGHSVANAIGVSEPTNRPIFHSSGLVAFQADDNFKYEKQLLLDHVDDILTE